MSVVVSAHPIDEGPKPFAFRAHACTAAAAAAGQQRSLSVQAFITACATASAACAARGRVGGACAATAAALKRPTENFDQRSDDLVRSRVEDLESTEAAASTGRNALNGVSAVGTSTGAAAAAGSGTRRANASPERSAISRGSRERRRKAPAGAGASAREHRLSADTPIEKLGAKADSAGVSTGAVSSGPAATRVDVAVDESG